MRDPSAVQVDVIDAQGKPQTLLPPSATAHEERLPDSTPPFDTGIRPTTVLHRLPAGAVDVHCDDCSPEHRTLLADDGTMSFDRQLAIMKLDWTRNEMRIDFRDRRGSSFGSSFSYQASVATPWSNVAEVRRVSTPNRATGMKLLLSAAVTGALGGFAVGDGISEHSAPTKVFGGILIPLAVVLAIGGSWYALAPPREMVLYSDKPGAAAR